jgi:hypothetical protein
MGSAYGTHASRSPPRNLSPRHCRTDPRIPQETLASQSRTNVTFMWTRKAVTAPSVTSTFCSLT